MDINFGYVRVSTKEQNIERQLNILKSLGIQENNIYIDKQSGKNFERPGYINMKNLLRKGDTLFVSELDRLGRNYKIIVEEWNDIVKNIGCNIVVADMPLLDTRKHKSSLDNFTTDLVLNILSYVAENEREKIQSRIKEGLKVAKDNNVKLGRPSAILPINFGKYYCKWEKNKITAVEFAKLIGVSRTTLYRYIKQYK